MSDSDRSNFKCPYFEYQATLVSPGVHGYFLLILNLVFHKIARHIATGNMQIQSPPRYSNTCTKFSRVQGVVFIFTNFLRLKYTVLQPRLNACKPICMSPCKPWCKPGVQYWYSILVPLYHELYPWCKPWCKPMSHVHVHVQIIASHVDAEDTVKIPIPVQNFLDACWVLRAATK